MHLFKIQFWKKKINDDNRVYQKLNSKISIEIEWFQYSLCSPHKTAARIDSRANLYPFAKIWKIFRF